MNLFELFSSAKHADYNLESKKDLIDSSKLMGMGLAYCNKILTKMDSKLELSTAINVGSTFSFRIKSKIHLVPSLQQRIIKNCTSLPKNMSYKVGNLLIHIVLDDWWTNKLTTVQGE